MTEISSTELNRNIASYVTRVEEGETFDITRRGEVVARLIGPDAVSVPARDVPWQRHASAGRAGSVVAADGRRHIRDFPCPPGAPYYLSDDRHLWLPDWPPPNLKVTDAILRTAFPQRR